MDISAIVDGLTQLLREEANVHAVFGEPVKIDTKTIVPVALVTASLSEGPSAFDLRAVPFGFLQEVDGQVRFTPLDPGHAVSHAEHTPSLAERAAASAFERVRDRVAELTGGWSPS